MTSMGTWREILVAVAGLTPQVITETLYYLTHVRDPPAAIGGSGCFDRQNFAPLVQVFRQPIAQWGVPENEATTVSCDASRGRRRSR